LVFDLDLNFNEEPLQTVRRDRRSVPRLNALNALRLRAISVAFGLFGFFGFFGFCGWCRCTEPRRHGACGAHRAGELGVFDGMEFDRPCSSAHRTRERGVLRALRRVFPKTEHPRRARAAHHVAALENGVFGPKGRAAHGALVVQEQLAVLMRGAQLDVPVDVGVSSGSGIRAPHFYANGKKDRRSPQFPRLLCFPPNKKKKEGNRPFFYL
jgi:hypothetical protein